MKKIKIFVAYHKESLLIKNDVFEPIQVGRANSQYKLNMIGYDTGENISNKNSIYCELTALYWVWKNCKDIDYIGICHYRRFFLYSLPFKELFQMYFSKLKYYCKKLLFINDGYNFNCASFSNEKEIADLLNSFSKQIVNDVNENRIELFALKPIKVPTKNIRGLFVNPAGESVIVLLEEIVKIKYPNLYPHLIAVLYGSSFSYANMIIMKSETLDIYASFLFDVLAEHEKRVVNTGWCQNPLTEKCYSRLSGYLGELLTATFIHYFKNNNPDKIRLLYQLQIL